MAGRGDRSAAAFFFGLAVVVVGGLLTALLTGVLHLPSQSPTAASFQGVTPTVPSVTSGSAVISPHVTSDTTVVVHVPTTRARITTIAPPPTTDPPPAPPATVALIVNLKLTSNLPENTIRVINEPVGVDAKVYGAQGELSYSECSVAWTETVDGQLFRRGMSHCEGGGFTMFGIDNSMVGTHVIVATATDELGETGNGTVTVYVVP